MTTFADLLRGAEGRDSYWVEHAKLDFAIDLDRVMGVNGLRKTDLAARFGKSPAYITKVLRGDSNLTIASMVSLARAAGGTLHIHIAPQTASVRWFDILGGKSAPKPDALTWANNARNSNRGQLSLAA